MENENKKEKKSSVIKRPNGRCTYEVKFLKKHSMKNRGEKAIYVRDEYHQRLIRIASVIGEDKIPLYAYLDNILEHHFQLFEQRIMEDYNKKNKPIF